MSNEEAYAGGLLNRALDPATQPPEIRTFLEAEIELLRDLAADGMRVIDLGCGTGRHLALLRDRLALGVGVDYQHAYLVEARARAGSHPLHFVTGDATAVPIASTFDLAICMTNTWGTMSDKVAGCSPSMLGPRWRRGASGIDAWGTEWWRSPTSSSAPKGVFDPSTFRRLGFERSSVTAWCVRSRRLRTLSPSETGQKTVALGAQPGRFILIGGHP